MSAQESSSSGNPGKQYLSKKVIINGQFVTLYSTNGVTWLSSPEDIPDTMARLESTRITLSEVKPEGDTKDPNEKEKKAEKQAPVVKTQGSQYRMKGPKPRPVLKQGGKVVRGTPIEPVNASSVNIKGAADTTIPTLKITPLEEGIRRGKIVAPIAQRRPGKPKIAPPPKKVAAQKVAAPPPQASKKSVAVKSKQLPKAAASNLKSSKGVAKVVAPKAKTNGKSSPAKAKKPARVAAKVARPKKTPAKVTKKVVASAKKKAPSKKATKRSR